MKQKTFIWTAILLALLVFALGIANHPVGESAVIKGV